MRIGARARFAGDRIDPARDLAQRGALDCLALACLAERTLAYGHLQRLADPSIGLSVRFVQNRPLTRNLRFIAWPRSWLPLLWFTVLTLWAPYDTHPCKRNLSSWRYPIR